MSRDTNARLQDEYDDYDTTTTWSGAADQRLRSDKARGKPKAKRRAADLLLAPDELPASSDTAFADPDMQNLYHRGYFDELLGVVKGGKEATVFLVASGSKRLAAKVYADIEARSFQDDGAYWNGVPITDARIAKAMTQRSGAGQAARISMWVGREYSYLWYLHGAGLPVPRPAVGPEVSLINEAGAVVLMEFVGDGDQPAPRLSDVRLTPTEADSAFRQSRDILLHLARLGLVHGDFSTYNLLWHQGHVVLIDVPQMLELRSSRTAVELLQRDVRSLATSFKRLRVNVQPEELWQQVQASVPRERWPI